MPVDKIVINASPLILLCNSGLDFILPQIFTDIAVPEAVWQEIVKSPYSDKAAQMLPNLACLKKISVVNVEEVIRWDLGAGETEVLSFGFHHRKYTPMIDDMAAKKCAMSFDMPTIGTGSTLILAKEQGLIDSVEHALGKLQSAGLWISASIINLLKEQAGE